MPAALSASAGVSGRVGLGGGGKVLDQIIHEEGICAESGLPCDANAGISVAAGLPFTMKENRGYLGVQRGLQIGEDPPPSWRGVRFVTDAGAVIASSLPILPMTIRTQQRAQSPLKTFWRSASGDLLVGVRAPWPYQPGRRRAVQSWF